MWSCQIYLSEIIKRLPLNTNVLSIVHTCHLLSPFFFIFWDALKLKGCYITWIFSIFAGKMWSSKLHAQKEHTFDHFVLIWQRLLAGSLDHSNHLHLPFSWEFWKMNLVNKIQSEIWFVDFNFELLTDQLKQLWFHSRLQLCPFNCFTKRFNW